MAAVDEPAGLGAWRAFLLTHAAVVRRLERLLEHEQQLPLAWYDVLLELNSAPERRLRMQDLAARVVLSRSRVSRVVDEMVRAGLVRREPDPSDGRASSPWSRRPGAARCARPRPTTCGASTSSSSPTSPRPRSATIERAFGRVLDAQHALDQREPRAG